MKTWLVCQFKALAFGFLVLLIYLVPIALIASLFIYWGHNSTALWILFAILLIVFCVAIGHEVK